ncbi:MAG: restriction endonuclease subunit S [Nitrospira sp.]|nr:restriction endonuclease subunit S [Nitrospira sp.]
MNPEQLLHHFDCISEAPDAIPRLRRFILDLAVRGKLAEQDPRDEPASELLTRIQDEKARLVKTSELKKLESFEPVEAHEIPFTIPLGWEVMRMGWLARKLGAGSTPLGGKAVYQSEGVPLLRSQNVHDDGLRLNDVARISRSIHERMSGTHVQHNDILLNITGASIGRCALVSSTFVEGNVSQHVAIIRLFLPDIRQFIHLSLTSPLFQKVIDDVQVGVSREGLSMQRLRLFPMLIPPLAEQQRIVAKVDELMALCDRLEAAQAERENRRDRLAAASLNRLNQPSDDPSLFQDQAHFYFHHLPRLTTSREHIQQLRRTILNLAVCGKLMPQDSCDEPASELLKRIQSEQEELVKARVLKHDGGDLMMLEEDLPYKLPSKWQWTSLRSIIVFGPQNGISPKPSTRPNAPTAITLTATTSGIFNPHHFKQVEANISPDSEFWLRSGDLLFQRGNTREYVGIAAYYTGEPRLFLYPDLMMKVRLSEKVSLRYVHLCAIAPAARDYFFTYATGAQATMPKINQGTLLRLPIPLSPIEEQHRIVAKVDELMALCDKLELQLATTRTDSHRLLEAVLHYAIEQTA